MRRHRQFTAAILFALVVPATLRAQPTPRPEGAEALALALRKLDTTPRVLMIGAHPDDENTAVIAELALGRGAEVAYLSLTRGEGGQNLIGPELQEGLGLIRSEELLAARQIDGARQFFTRAYDYGFSKSAEEAFTQWPKDTLLADVVAVVRRFRPDIIVSVFSGTPRDGHGQHQAAGILAREAFEAAGDPARFPEQLAAGVAAHQPAALVQSLFRGTAEGAITLETGTWDPVLGRSWFQAAMASRSRHRSQDMGTAQPPGPQQVALVPMAGRLQPGAPSLFAGVDTALAQRAAAAGLATELREELHAYEAGVRSAIASFNPLRPGAVVDPLLAAARALEAMLRRIGEDDGGGDFAFHLAAERADIERALALAAGIIFDVTASRRDVVPGETVDLAVRVWNGGAESFTIADAGPRITQGGLPVGWDVEALDRGGTIELAPGELLTRRFRVHVPIDARLTQPYFLRRPRDGALYRWPDRFELRGLPFEPAPFAGTARIVVDGVSIALDREAHHVEVDKSLGELRLPVSVVPAVSLEVSPSVLVSPVAAREPAHEVAVTLRAQQPGLVGALVLDLPDGWTADPDSVVVAFDDADRRTVRFAVRPPASGEDTARITARFRGAEGMAWDAGYTVIAYPHTRPRPLYSPAVTRVARIDVRIAADLRIGYIEGAGDDGASVLRQLGARVEPLDAAALAGADLSVYDAIIAGIRAYEVRPDLIASNSRVLDYVRAGGTFIVQYNKYELVEEGFTPAPMTMARPHGRVTDETAEVRILDPSHPLMSWPNRIDARDFEGWVQERGLYFGETWDDRYVPLLEMSDPGEPPLRGSLLATREGAGWYVYSALALFRQWPEAVPGAFRLLANMASLGKAPSR